MRIAMTANGPGEFAGWVRPLLAALLACDPSAELHVLAVPDDFATGRDVTRQAVGQRARAAGEVEDSFPGSWVHPVDDGRPTT